MAQTTLTNRLTPGQSALLPRASRRVRWPGSLNVVANRTPCQSLQARMNTSAPAESLEWTGERLVTSCNRPLVYEHLHRYAIACAVAPGKRVLDIACGEGYGSNLLARVAASVIGVDLDAKTIAHARAKYSHRNLEFLEGSCDEIPCADGSIDLVASFETIEHISDHARFMSELKRVLAPGGMLVISSPDKAEYRRRSEAGNPFHQAELTHSEFIALMKQSFKHCISARQRLVVGSWIAPDVASAKVANATFHGDFRGIETEPGVHHGVYSLAICSGKPLPTLPLGLFEDERVTAQTWSLLDRAETPAELLQQMAEGSNATQILKERNEHFAILQAEAAKILKERDEHIAILQAEAAKILKERDEHIAILQGEAAERTRQVTESRQAFDEKVRHLGLVQAELAERTQQLTAQRAAFDEKSKHVALLERQLDERTAQLSRSTEAFDEKVRHVAALQRELHERTQQMDHFRTEADRQTHAVERLRMERQLTEDRLARVSNELMDVRWEALTARAGALLDGDPVDNHAVALLELENRVHVAETETEHLRQMLKAVQADLEEQQAAREVREAKLKATVKQLRFHQKQMARLKEITSRKLVLPFGKAQRRIQQLTAATRADD